MVRDQAAVRHSASSSRGPVKQAGEMSARLRRHGAVPEEVPTISVEPPRAPQQMDRALQGPRVRALSLGSPSRRSTPCGRFGRSSRSTASTLAHSPASRSPRSEQTAAALVAFGVRPDLVPSGEQSSTGLLEDVAGDATRCSTRSTRVFLALGPTSRPRRLRLGSSRLGWRSTTSRRTGPCVRRRPRGDAGCHQGRRVRRRRVHVVLDRAQPGRDRGQAPCRHGPSPASDHRGRRRQPEEHGLRVDVMAESPSAVGLADALAAYGAVQRLSALEVGDATWRPSQRRGAARRKAK